MGNSSVSKQYSAGCEAAPRERKLRRAGRIHRRVTGLAGAGLAEWWKEEEPLPDGKKWRFLEHNGVIFPPEYQAHGVKMRSLPTPPPAPPPRSRCVAARRVGTPAGLRTVRLDPRAARARAWGVIWCVDAGVGGLGWGRYDVKPV